MPQANDNHITPTRRLFIEDRIERLIAVLDAADPDPDLEPSLAYGDGPGDDREGDPADDEPELGWTVDINQERASRHYQRCQQFGQAETGHDDREPSLGSLDGEIDQTRWASGDGRDLEADYVAYRNGAVLGLTADMEPNNGR